MSALFNTGVDNNGDVLPDGSSEQNWRLTSSPSGSTTLTVGESSFDYAQPPAGSQWVTPRLQNDNDDVGNYHLELDFFIPTSFDVSTAVLSGLIGADNRVTLFLNDEQVTTEITTFGTLTNVVITRGFQSGNNQLVAVLTNDPVGNRYNPSAFLFSNAELTGITIFGDVDGDCDVDDTDLGIAISNFTGPIGVVGGKTPEQGDVDSDGDVDDTDLGIAISNFTGPLEVLAPEPTSALVTSLGALFLIRRRRLWQAGNIRH